MEDHPIGREEYIHQVLSAYRQTPGTAGTIRRPDRLLAAQLYARGVPLRAVKNALVLAASRRLVRPTDAPPLGTIRSLAYHAASGIMPHRHIATRQAALSSVVKSA